MSYKMKGFSGFKPSPAKAKDKKDDFTKATMNSVKGDKWDDKHQNEMSQMSYTDEYANKSMDNLKSNYTKGKTFHSDKGKDGNTNTQNADVVRAYRDQQKNLKNGNDTLGNSIK